MAWGKPTYPKPTTQSTNAAEYTQPKPPTNIGAAGAALGVGAGVVKPVPNQPMTSGAAIGVGGGSYQGGSQPAPTYPTSSGGGGGGGSTAFGAGTGMTADDWAALIAAQQQSAYTPPPTSGTLNGQPLGNLGQEAIAGGTPVPQLPALPPGEGSSIYSDPGFLSLIAGMESELAGSESGMRRQQDETRRRFTENLPMFERNWDQNRGRIRNQYEGRGLLKSGGTEDALSRSYQSQGDERARMEAGVADAVANLEQQIAQARAGFNTNKAQMALQYAGQQPVT
jgi:hypothetical protein